MYSIKEAALDITLHFLKMMKQDELADTLKDELVFIYQRQLKSNLKKKHQCVFEGIAKQGDSTLLNSIYTDLYITQGGSERVNTEHEVRQIEISRRAESQEIPIECTNLFESPEQGKEIRTVLTKGVAGIGKSISVQKFILDWAEEKENQDISFIFPLPFREMNLKEEGNQSLMNLVSQFFPEVKGLNLTRNDKFKVLFILDGLDECRLPLNFKDNETWRDVSSPASLDVLLTNLIRGNLLPSALIWITTRPAAASKIPPYCIDRVTEVRGFNDEQKEEYFRKRFTDKKMANTIIDHVKKSKSLFIMCHIPVFCWISATVLQNILEEKLNNPKFQTEDASKTLQESNTEDIPKTLTQMYTHFLRFQIQQSRRKYEGEYTPDVSWDKDAILSLGKLAFRQLERNNLIFYDADLEACGIDASKASLYSGMCTQIFKEETGIILDTMYCFVHMSIQEFIAALYAHLFLDINKKNVFDQESTEQRNKNEAMIDLLEAAVDKALESDIGHLDLFLRFLLGLSLESNCPLLRGLLTQQDSNDQSKEDIVQYIKKKLGENLSPERSINLFYCLNELNDQTLVKDIQTQLSKGSLSSADLSPAQWSALAFVLLTSEKELEVFELQKFKKSDECLIRLSAVIKTSKRALLSKCDLTKESCSALAPVLSSDSSDLKDLDLSNNNLEDSGVKLLCDGLKNNCKLEKIRLSNCGITEEGYKALASALRSNPSHLIELDLTGNDPGQSGVKELNDLLQDQNCQLKTLRFLGPDAEEACKYLTGGLHIKNPLLMSELNLSERKLGDTRVKQISALLQDKHCTLNTLMLNNNSITAEGCAALTSAFNSNPSNLIELDLSGNKLGNSGIEEICPLLENTQCRLEKLKLSDCSIREEGYKALASALRSNPSHLIELDLTGNDPGQSGVKELNDLLQNERCKLKIRFLKSPAAQEACDYLTKVLSISPLLLTELDLSEDKLGDLDWEKLSALLMDSHCKVEKIKLNNCDLTEKSCSVLATVLSSKTILKELNLNNSRLLDSGVKQICEGLKNPVCQLEILKLSDCSITEEGYEALASALRSNPSYLIELDLTGNDPGQSGVKELDDLLQDPNCQLKTLRFLDPAADEACQFVTGIVGKNLLLLRELNLSKRELGDTRVNQITALLQDKHCKLNILMLRDCGLTEKSCSALATVLRSNSSLKELDISNNNIMDSGVKKLQNALENTKCTLEKLRLSDCSITEEGYKALASALRSNPSHLIELDLTGNDPGQSGVKELNDLLQDQNCQLKTLRFLSRAADEACQFVNRVLGENLLLLRELNLSENKLGPSGLKKLAAVLPDKHCKLNTLILNNSNITDEDCRVLTEALNSNPSNLTELNLSGTKLRDSGLKIFSAVFKNEQCQLEKLKLNCSSITAESCSVLASALNLNLKELELNENNLGNSGVTEISTLLGNSQCTLKILRLSECSITEEGYKALASALRSNPSHLIELDLTGNDPGQSGVKELNDLLQDQNCQLKTLRFLGPDADEACQYVRGIVGKNPLLLRELNLSKCALGDTRVNQIAALLKDKHCKLNTLMLRDCGLTEESCSALATVLRSNSSLKELDISNNNLQDSGVKKLQNALENTICTLEKLRLSDCSIREEGYKALASALRSNPSHLIELDLTGNDPGQSGVKELNDLLQDQNCQLKTLRFLGPAAYEACQFVTGIVGINPLFLRELNLSGRELGDTRVNQIAALLKDKHCKLNTLMLNNNSITAEGCAALTSAFNSNPSNLIELDLSGNKLGNSGMEKICPLLKNTQCRLEKLKLSDCSISEEGYKALASALRSNTSHLIELDLTGNDPGQSGVKELNDLLQDERYTLKTIRFLKSPAAQEACDYLTKVLGESPLLLTELDLSEDKLGDLDGEKLSALLMDSHSKVEKIKLNNCELTEKSCSVLATVLSSKTILKELNLNNSRLLDSGVKQICEGLKNPVCHLEILKLSDCSISEEGYKALASALRSNPSHLIELDLTGNDPGQSGVKELNDLLQDQNCQLKTLRFLSHAAEEACKYLTEDLHIKNPLLLSELNLSRHELGDTRVNQITALLQDKHCQLNTLILCGCSITENQCHTLTSALFPNLSHLRELDLSGNQIKHTGAKNISDVLKDSRCQLERLRLRNCGLTEESCSALATVLRSNSSLKELDISNNNLQDSGVKKLQNALENTNCTLEKLRLSGCCITEEGYKSLASALRSNPSHLIELDLTGNDPGQSGVKELNDLLQDQNCQLKTLRFLSHAAEEACKYLTEDLHIKNPLLLRELNLSGHELGDTRVNQIAALLQDKHCQLNTLILCGCSITDKQCYTLTSALFPNLSHLRELDLSGNQIKHTGAKNISDVLKDSRCQLERLRLRGCDMKDEGCSAVTSALILNPSHLRELDLSGNKPGDSGFKDLSDLLMNPQCKLENLQLCKCSIKEKQCVSLTSALKSNPSHLRELNLSENKLKHKRLKHFYDLLKDSRCKLERLRLRSCDIADEDCSALTSALKSNPSHLRELDLSGNKLGDSGVDNLGLLLSRAQCNLEKLHLCGCSITEKQCLKLTQDLCLRLSNLRALDFSGNQIENTGVNHLCELLTNPRCKLERLSLNECGITDVSSLTQSLTNTKALQFLKELDLRKNNIGSSKQQIIDLLQDSSCNLSLEEEGWISTAANVFSSIGGLFTTRSKAQDEPVKSAAQAKPPSDERSSKGTPDHSSEVDKQYEGSAV
ncbi:protein NLRC5-like isoform X3 [Chanodichthys erythropterus]|uniref:protein NLRC5-like isoform X3 n=1 Tax=Chanodichthys erythropterus TaxID=933992 RepID=UPI00351DD595